MTTRAAELRWNGVQGMGLAVPRARKPRRREARALQPIPPATAHLLEVRVAVAPRLGEDVFRRVALRDPPRGPLTTGLAVAVAWRATRRTRGLHWRLISLAIVLGLVLGVAVGGGGILARDYLYGEPAAPLPGVTAIRPQPLSIAGTTDVAPPPSPTPLPARVLLQVPYTTQAPLANWAQHQESCEAATLTMLLHYWQHDSSLVIDPQVADGSIRQIDGWKMQPDLTDTMLGDLAQQHFGYAYRTVPNDPQSIAEQLAAGRPLIAEVRTHGLGNAHYPGYSSHYEQAGWSVPHFVLIIGYDSTGVWLNDAGITLGRGYHISYDQLTHAIDDLNGNYPALANGNVLLVAAPQAVLSPVTPQVLPASVEPLT